MRFYDIKRHWSKRIEPQLPTANDILVRDFNKFTYGRWRQEFKPGDVPHNFESCDWWWDHRGVMPRYWQYVKHSACHWLVNFNLKLAMLVEPKRPWRIVTSDRHSTVWDGTITLFDLNGLALFGDPDETFKLADEEHLPPGEFLEIGYAQHFVLEMVMTDHKNATNHTAKWLARLTPETQEEMIEKIREYGRAKGWPAMRSVAALLNACANQLRTAAA